MAWSHKQPFVCWHIISLGANDSLEDQMVQNLMNRKHLQPARVPVWLSKHLMNMASEQIGDGHLALSMLPMELMEKLLLGT